MHNHRDMLKDEIEQIGKVFAKIIGCFFQLKAKGNPALAIKIANEQFKDELNINVQRMLKLTNDELQQYFNSRKLQTEHLKLLTDYMLEVAKYQLLTRDENAKKTLVKVLEIEDLIQQSKNVHLFDDYTESKTAKQIEANNLIIQIKIG